MPPTKEKVQRIHICITPDLLGRIERYREGNGITNRTIAITELIRKGLEEE